MKKFIKNLAKMNPKIYVNYSDLHNINLKLTPDSIKKNINSKYTIEHIIPQSFSKIKCNSNRDLHVLTTYSDLLNKYRSNYGYDNIDIITDKHKIMDMEGGLVNYNFSIHNKNLTAIKCNENKIFSPQNIYKGIIARSIMYYYVMYSQYNSEIFNNIINPNTLINWHYKYPVTKEEYERNLNIYLYQGNLNPFILYPELIQVVIHHELNIDSIHFNNFNYKKHFYKFTKIQSTVI